MSLDKSTEREIETTAMPSPEVNVEILDESHHETDGASSEDSVSISFSLTLRSTVSHYERIMMRNGLSAVLPYDEGQRKSEALLLRLGSGESVPEERKSADDAFDGLFFKKKTMGLRISDKKGFGVKFQFVEYCPDVFSALRNLAGISEDRYLSSVGLHSQPYITFKSNSKSGQFFFLSRDQRFIIKTISQKEYKIFRSILKSLYLHHQSNPSTLLVSILGLYKLKPSRTSRKLYFIIMRNICSGAAKHKIEKRFDLKGSYIGRSVSQKDHLKESAVLKDQEFARVLLSLGKKKRKHFLHQLQKDCDFLASQGLMDYSMFVAIHDISKCEHSHKSFIEQNAVNLTPSLSIDPEAVEETSKDSLGHYVYYFGLIDFFTSFSMKKKMEHFIKKIVYDEDDISAVSPIRYAKRLYKFISEHLCD